MLCIFFIIIEIAGGYYANSIAVMTDACHMLSDSLSIFLSIIAIRISRLPGILMIFQVIRLLYSAPNLLI